MRKLIYLILPLALLQYGCQEEAAPEFPPSSSRFTFGSKTHDLDKEGLVLNSEKFYLRMVNEDINISVGISPTLISGPMTEKFTFETAGDVSHFRIWVDGITYKGDRISTLLFQVDSVVFINGKYLYSGKYESISCNRSLAEPCFLFEGEFKNVQSFDSDLALENYFTNQ